MICVYGERQLMGMGRPGPARCLLRGPRACHGQEILFSTRTDTSPHGPACGPNAPFLCFFYLKTIKNTKIQHKTWPGSREARARPVDKFIKFQARPATHAPRPGPTRHLLKPVNRPGMPTSRERDDTLILSQ